MSIDSIVPVPRMNKRPPEALTSSGFVTSLNGPGWICRAVQRCEHAEGARSTTTDLTLIRRCEWNPKYYIMAEFPRQMGRSAGFQNEPDSTMSCSVDSTIDSTPTETRALTLRRPPEHPQGGPCDA